MNAIQLLKDDHSKVKRLFNSLTETTERATKRRKQLLGEIERELKIHAKLEEELFYPAFRKAAESARKKDDREIFFEATEEHHVVDLVLPELIGAATDSEEFGARAKVLKELVEHHIEEEEKGMFARARALMDRETLADLGELMEARKASLEAQWKNPILRPIKRIGGAIDKMVPTSVKNAKVAAISKVMSTGRSSKKGSRSAREQRA
jgi:hemerythrin superfamily protein